MSEPEKREKLYSGMVWIISGVFLSIYGILGLANNNVPGVEELIAFIHSLHGSWLYLGAFLAIFIEGLYVVGSFFPGSTLVLLIAIAAQLGGWTQFFGIILTIYLGWLLAGLVNIFGAKYFKKALHLDPHSREPVEDNTGVTWFPAFRANTEVGQIAEGHEVREVLLSAWRVRTYACIGAAIYAIIIPLLLDIENRTNEQGFWSLAIIALINFAVGGYKLYQYHIN